MTDREFDEFRKLISQRIGIGKSTMRKDMVELDLGVEIVSELRSSFDETLDILRMASTSEELWQRYAAKLCNPESYFFREQKQLEAIAEILRASKEHSLRIWSIPCSSGEEPYSLALLLLRKGVRDFQIIGSDIRADLLRIAEEGTYEKTAYLHPFRSMPDEFWGFFYRDGVEGKYRISENVKRFVTFAQANILEPETMPSGLFHVVLCRNLLIYFDSDAKAKALKQLWKKLLPGGYLCVGASDSIYDQLEALEGVDDTVGNSIYRKKAK